MKVAKPLGLAFLFGGVFAVIGQAVAMLWAPILGADSPFMGFAILVTMGVIGVVMFVTGLHQKLAPLAGFGLILPFNGFCAAISDAFVSGSAEAGGAKAGAKAALGLVGYVLGWGCLCILVVAVCTVIAGMVM